MDLLTVLIYISSIAFVYGVSEYDCVVIGAGISGTAAASALHSKGLRVIVLEARDRIGGRVYTTQTTLSNGKKFEVDLGASWIHGAGSDNPLVGLLKEAGVKVSRKSTDYDNTELFYSNGSPVSYSQEMKYEATWEEFMSFLGEKQDQYDYDPGLKTVVNSFIKEKKLTGQNLRAFNYGLNVNIELEYAAPISNLSLWFDEDEGLSGEDVLVLGGYEGVVEYLASGLDIALNSTVKTIDYSKNDQVTVSIEQPGDVPSKSYTAKAVVVTLPLGVLQDDSVRFIPRLPKVNTNAIKSLGFGLLNKCVLIFEKAFWGSEVEFIERIDAMGGFEEILSLMPAAKAPVLYGFNAADYAEDLEKRTDEQTCGEMLARLRTIWDDAPNYLGCFVSRWGLDPYSKGSYSYTTPLMGYKKSHRDVGKSVGQNRVQFAGEHTSLDNPATVHGALTSGYEAACRVLQHLGKEC